MILHEDINIIKQCQQIIAEWLQDMGLELKPSKTRLAHTLNRYEQQEPGFNFLGFYIRQYPVGQNYSARNPKGKVLGFKTIIKPSKEALRRHTEQISKIIDIHRAAPQVALIGKLNPIIRGWTNYYLTSASKKTFAKAYYITYQQLQAWAKRRHPNKSRGWVADKYWHTIGTDNWVFLSKDGEKTTRLIKHQQTPIVRHIKVQDNRSPYDGDWIYWSTRMGKHPETPMRVAKLLKSQKGKCSLCGLFFKDGDSLEVDHIIPKSQGGKDKYDNFQLLHRHCHHYKTTLDVTNLQDLDDNYLYENPF